MSILGNRVLRKEDPKFLTTGGVYVDDLPLEGAAHVHFVRSTVAHARITSIDTSDAAKAPGVIAVVTADDLDIGPLAPSPPLFNGAMTRPVLATGTVRFVGEAVVAIVTEERYQGPDAGELVFIDYEPLTPVVDPGTALADGDLLFPEAGTNVAMDLAALGMAAAPTDDFFDGCEVVVRQRVLNQRVAPAPLEVRATAARVEDDGRLMVWLSNQSPHGSRNALAGALGIEADQVHVITPDVGGGFGVKMGVTPEEVLVPWLARRLGRPVRWVETRSENLTAHGHGRAQIQEIEIGGKRDGTIEAYRLVILQDTGAYPAVGGFLPFLTRMMASGVYTIPKVECTAKTVVTNTTPVFAYRGAGRPEAAAGLERAVDMFAVELGMDPAEVRRKNFIGKDAFPYTTPTGTTYDIGDYHRALDLVLEAAGYQELRAEQARRREAGDVRQIGIGLAVYVEVTGGPYPDKEWGAVEVRPDGSAVVRTGTSPHGQGHETAWSMLVSDTLGIPMDKIEVVHGDTDLVPQGGGTAASRSLQLGGVAVHQAAEQVVDKARELAAQLLEANPDDLVLDKVEGRFHVTGTPSAARTWAELAGEAVASGGLMVEHVFSAASPTFPFGAHLAVVEVDTETGGVELTRLVAVDDAGKILNPLLADGQIHGGLAQGAAQALLEEVRYDEDGNPITSNFADYAFISAAELPSFELVSMETPTPINPLGAKGIGESGTIGSTPAVQNAVVDALAHLGVRHVDMPASPERIWRTIQDHR